MQKSCIKNFAIYSLDRLNSASSPLVSISPDSVSIHPSPSPRLSLTVERADGCVGEVPEGEFRSEAGRLLFVRRGDRIEIRCPRSKELFLIHFSLRPSAGT
jgi:hypothetical protein